MNPLQTQNQLADLYVRQFITLWFWPYFIMGNADTWTQLGITMNGARPIKC